MTTMRRRPQALLWPVLVVVVGLVASLTIVWFAQADDRTAGESEPAATADDTGPTRYLALGDSLAAGYQPGVGDDRTGGYVGGVLAGLQAQRPDDEVTLVNLGCSGETTTTLLQGGRCAYPEGSQLKAALAALASPGPPVDVITVDVGANDLTGCASPSGVDQSCAEGAVASVTGNLATALGQLRGAAPSARIVVLDYYDPFLATWTLGQNGQQLAQASAVSTKALNAAIAGVAQGVQAQVAPVSELFATDDFTIGAGQTLPRNVELICARTWMCERSDIHTNDAGYEVLTQAVLTALRLPG